MLFSSLSILSFVCLSYPFYKEMIKWLYPTLIKNQIFLIYNEIESRAVAKSYMMKGFLVHEEMRKYFPIYEEPLVIWLCNCSIMNFLIYELNLIFFFISVLCTFMGCRTLQGVWKRHFGQIMWTLLGILVYFYIYCHYEAEIRCSNNTDSWNQR